MDNQNYPEPKKSQDPVCEDAKHLSGEEDRFNAHLPADSHLAPSTHSNVGAVPAFQSLLKELRPNEQILGQFIAGVNTIGLEAPKRSCAFLLTGHRLLYGHRSMFRNHRRSLDYAKIEGIRIYQAGSLGTILIDAGADSLQILTQSRNQTDSIAALLEKTVGLNGDVKKGDPSGTE